jgi:hypothetical protein
MLVRRMCSAVVLLVLALAVGQGAFASVTVNYSYSDSTEFEVNLAPPNLEPVIVASDTFTRLVFSGAYPALLDSGKPEVAVVPVMLAVPDGGSMSLTVLEKIAVPLRIHNVYPQQPFPYSYDGTGDFAYDTAFYQQDVVYPGPDVEFGSNSDGHWRELRVVRLAVYPVQVNPARDSVAFTIHLKVRVRHTGAAATQYVFPRWLVPLYSRAVDNFGRLNYTCESEGSYESGTRCLIICHQNYAGTKLPLLADWINRRGYETKVIYGAWPEKRDREEVQQLIQDEYASSHHLRWVLLVGNVEPVLEIPTGAQSPHGDYGYTLLEPGDDVPDIGITRITSRSPANLDSIVDKILAYEK